MTVVIKTLHKQEIVLPAQGGEDPFAEISVMQHHVDHEHIYGCYEALEDEDILYIVMLQARHGDLFEHIRWRPRGVGYTPRQDVPRRSRGGCIGIRLR